MSLPEDRDTPLLAAALLHEAWGEFRYPRPALDEPSVGMARATAALLRRLEAHYRTARHSPVDGDFERLADEIVRMVATRG